MASSSTHAPLRSNLSRKFLFAVLDGKRVIKSPKDARLFLEAVCSEQDRSSTVEKLVASSHGLQALMSSLRYDLSTSFINEAATAFLAYISHADIKQLYGGQLLRDVLAVVVEPPTFWNALERSYAEKSLSMTAIRGFAWLLLELLTSQPGHVEVPVFQVAERVTGAFLTSTDHETRGFAYRIQEVLRSTASGTMVMEGARPGGRHDNDFEDFRKIAIFPTADELIAKEPPFYLQADAVQEIEPQKRVAAHLDNQFRLLREEMLGELRNDLQIAQGKRQGRRTSRQLQDLVLDRVHCGINRGRKPASFGLRCYRGVNIPKGSKEERRKYFAENKNILKHESFGCLLRCDEIVAFATVERNEDLLAENPPIMLLRVFGASAIMKTLMTLKTSHQRELQFVVVDTAFFAYEPILRSLQAKTSVPLSDELLGGSGRFQISPFCPKRLVARIRDGEGRSLREVLGLRKDVKLDRSQTESLVSGLSQNVSLIQGPPGELLYHSVECPGLIDSAWLTDHF